MLVKTFIVKNAAEDRTHPFNSGCTSGGRGGEGSEQPKREWRGGRGSGDLGLRPLGRSALAKRGPVLTSGRGTRRQRHRTSDTPARQTAKTLCTGTSFARERVRTMPQGPGYLALPTIDSIGSADSPGGNKDQPPRVVSLGRL